MEHTFTGVFDKQGDWYIAWIEELPGANTQGKTLEEARHNLIEATELILKANRELAEKELVGKTVIREQVQVSV